MKQPESRLQRAIRAVLAGAFPDSWWTKYHGGPFTRAGVPDLLGSVRGRFVALEVKRPREMPSDVQLHQLSLLARSGAICAVVDGVECAVQVVELGLTGKIVSCPVCGRLHQSIQVGAATVTVCACR